MECSRAGVVVLVFQWHVCLFCSPILPQKAVEPNKSMLRASPFQHDILGPPHICPLCVHWEPQNDAKRDHVSIEVHLSFFASSRVIHRGSRESATAEKRKMVYDQTNHFRQRRAKRLEIRCNSRPIKPSTNKIRVRVFFSLVRYLSGNLYCREVW